MIVMRTAAIAAAMLVSSAALATEGYFQNGSGARQKALAGAGAADSKDATAISLNPAGLVHAGNEVEASASLFSPRREYNGGGSAAALTPLGEVESDSNYFLVPNFAASYRLSDVPFADVVGIALYANGGMNTNYPAVVRGPGFFGPGVFQADKLGVDLQQAFLSVAIAKTLAPGISVGIAPVLARQQIKLRGLDLFAFNSSDPTAVSGRGLDVSWGAGVRGGIEWAISPIVRFGVAGNSRIYAQPFEKYRGLFAEQGDFDIPASIQAGIAVDVSPRLTLLADYRRIWFGSVKSVANPSTNAALLGTDDGPGFGWDDVDVFKVGAEWEATDKLTLRAGYAYATNPINARDVQFNILAPAVVQHHVSAGFEYAWEKAWSLELAGLYVPEETVSGVELGNPAHTIDISMHQFEVTVGVKYKFGDTVSLK